MSANDLGRYFTTESRNTYESSVSSCQKGATLDQFRLKLHFFNSPITPPFTLRLMPGWVKSGARSSTRGSGITARCRLLVASIHRAKPALPAGSSTRNSSVSDYGHAGLVERHMRETRTQRSSERNLLTLPSGREVTLRDGKALAVDSVCGETGRNDWRTAQPGQVSGNADCVMTVREILNVNTP